MSFCLISARKTGCKQRLHKPVDVDDSHHFKLKGKHTHTGDARKKSKKRIMDKLKTLAKTTNNTTRQIIVESMEGVKKATAAVLPSERTLTRMIHHYRTNTKVPKNPRELAELVLPIEYRQTIKGDNFLSYDSAEENMEYDGRVLIFSTKENLQFMSRCDQMYMDGTFDVTPILFSQVYTIHGEF